MIVSIVDRPRYGLVEHSEALISFLSKSGIAGKSYAPEKILNPKMKSEGFSILKLFDPRIKVIVIWSVGLTYLLLPIFLILGKKTIVVIHEPGGVLQRLNKGDSWKYSIAVSFFELLSIFAKVKVTPNKKNANSNLSFAPLLFTKKNSQPITLKKIKGVLYLGRKDLRRSYDIFSQIAAQNESTHFEFKSFPDKGKVSLSDKINFMDTTFVVLNLYKVDHNQSGVTGDALSFSRPVIISDKDAYAELIRKNSIGIVIPAELINIESVSTAIHRVFHNKALFTENINRIFNQEFGYEAFEKYWLCLFKK